MAENPPNGAIIDYYLKAAAERAGDARDSRRRRRVGPALLERRSGRRRAIRTRSRCNAVWQRRRRSRCRRRPACTGACGICRHAAGGGGRSRRRWRRRPRRGGRARGPVHGAPHGRRPTYTRPLIGDARIRVALQERPFGLSSGHRAGDRSHERVPLRSRRRKRGPSRSRSFSMSSRLVLVDCGIGRVGSRAEGLGLVLGDLRNRDEPVAARYRRRGGSPLARRSGECACRSLVARRGLVPHLRRRRDDRGGRRALSPDAPLAPADDPAGPRARPADDPPAARPHHSVAPRNASCCGSRMTGCSSGHTISRDSRAVDRS